MYDTVAVLGLKFAPYWQLLNDLIKRLDYTARLYHQGQVKQILLCGRWSIWFEWLGITPPITEAALMRDYLISKNVPRDCIHLEEDSMDTIGNILGLQSLGAARSGNSLGLVCATQSLPRVSFLCDHILGSTANLTLLPLSSAHFADVTTSDETATLHDQKAIVDSLLKDLDRNYYYTLYSNSYYTIQADNIQQLLETFPAIRQIHPSLAPDLADHLLRGVRPHSENLDLVTAWDDSMRLSTPIHSTLRLQTI